MAIIYDRSCEFVKSYYDPSLDKILNPLDSRCAAWDLWKECLTLPDFDNISNTLIPMVPKKTRSGRAPVVLSLPKART
nr:type IV secretion system DNA-binding domain-containing protein [Klebsiella pneumoniae]